MKREALVRLMNTEINRVLDLNWQNNTTRIYDYLKL